MYPNRRHYTQMSAYIDEDDQGEYADDTANLVGNNAPPLSLSQRLQMQIEKCQLYIKRLYNETQKTKKKFRSMKKEIETMKQQINGIESYIQNIEKEKEASYNRSTMTSTLPISFTPSIDGIPIRKRTQPRLVTVKPDPQSDIPVASTSKSLF